MRALCVSIHDVAPATWRACRFLADRIAEIDVRLPLTLLVVPNYHESGDAVPEDYKDWLDRRIARGDEIALHGYFHRDTSAPPHSAMDRMRRELYTAREGEFAALSEHQAIARIAAGVEWCTEHDWRIDGFVAPAWLMSPGTWNALRRADFLYTTTLAHFHLLQESISVRAPTVVYSSRAAWRRSVSHLWNESLFVATRSVPLLRVGLHPADVRYSAVVAHALSVIDRARVRRTALTKSDYAGVLVRERRVVT